MVGSTYGHIEIVKELIMKGADVNAKDIYKRKRHKEKQYQIT